MTPTKLVQLMLEEQKTPPGTWQVTVQKDHEGHPGSGYVQIDMIDADGENEGSTSAPKLVAQGFNLPDFSQLAQGRYRMADLLAKI
jgi:hypothetical protein